jgi:hypothetical protein
MTTRADITPVPQIAHVSPNPSPSQVIYDITHMLPTTINSEFNNLSDGNQLVVLSAIQPSLLPGVRMPTPGAPARAKAVKQPCTLAYPCSDNETQHKQTKTSTPVGTSKQAISK